MSFLKKKDKEDGEEVSRRKLEATARLIAESEPTPEERERSQAWITEGRKKLEAKGILRPKI